MSDNEIEAHIFTDKYTEGTFELPINITNIPSKLDLKVYPKKVTVTYKVGLKNYSKITEDSFEIVCDYKSSVDKGLTYLVPKFKKKSNLVSSVRVSPQKIDFLMLMFSAKAVSDIGFPLASSGQNQAFKKSLFQKVGGYKKISNLLMGDDSIFIQLCLKAKAKVAFCDNPSS